MDGGPYLASFLNFMAESYVPWKDLQITDLPMVNIKPTKQRIKDEDEIYLAVVAKMKTPERWRWFFGKMKMETISRK